jgi:hypothetical protein
MKSSDYGRRIYRGVMRKDPETGKRKIEWSGISPWGERSQMGNTDMVGLASKLCGFATEVKDGN